MHIVEGVEVVSRKSVHQNSNLRVDLLQREKVASLHSFKEVNLGDLHDFTFCEETCEEASVEDWTFRCFILRPINVK
jgi:hypothetical protein